MSQPGGPHAPSNQVIYQQVVRAPSNGMAVAALVLGLVAIVVGIWSPIPLIGFITAFFAFIPALLAVIFGVVGLRRAAQLARLGRGQALTGLILGAVTLAIIVLVTLGWIVLVLLAATQSSTVG